MPKVPDSEWVSDVIWNARLYDSDVQRGIERMWREEERLYNEEGKNVDMWDEFYKVAKEKLARAARELKRRGIDIEKIGWGRLRHMVKMLFIEWANNWFRKEAVSDDIIVYGETMGFILEEGEREWKVFEGSDEPGEIDMELYRKLILGKKGREKITLYGMHGRDFVMSWLEEGIPEGVYFAEEKWIAQRYWHAAGDDVLVKVKLPVDAVVKTADKEWKTLRWVDPDEFSLVVMI